MPGARSSSLENDGVLPLPSDLGGIAVIGPIADSARDLLGDYSHLVHIETLLEMREQDNAFGFAVTDEVSADRRAPGRRTLLDAIRDRFGTADIRYARGCGIQDGTDGEIAEAVAVATASDVAVLFLGERSGLTSDSTTGEFRDRRDLGFIGRQQELLEAVVATGTPVVLVVVSGRPLAIEWAAEPLRRRAARLGSRGHGTRCRGRGPGRRCQPRRQAARLDAPQRGAGAAHLPPPSVRWPLQPEGRLRRRPDVAALAVRLRALVHDVRALEPPPRRTAIPTEGGEIGLSVDVANVGDRAGDEVVQLYVRDEEASVARPVRELRGFRRVHLAPGERRTVTFRLGTEQLAYTGADYRRVIEPGTVRLWVGTSSADLPLCASVELVGPVVELRERNRYLTKTSVRLPQKGPSDARRARLTRSDPGHEARDRFLCSCPTKW